MPSTILLVIDAQQSFYHRGYQQAAETPAFERSLSALVAGCQRCRIPVVDVFHVEDQGPFSLASGWVQRLPFLTHQPAKTVYKRVHNALTESGLEPWLREQQVKHLIISGLRTEQCCETTARVASDLGYKVTFVTEATLTFPITHNHLTLSINDLRHRTESVLINRFAEIRHVDECLKELA
ncbi:isochorismatase family protein [Erwinia psidii]|uniref:Isochorismatase family protein n=1 Tax=Erwinia psidii TaxID=69224 RepID=A0A3N6S082_9GAMM|nr:isochorismatase family protein [Erwinia psidii]MCX8958391.1 isochorismatase family protein [Erwinia psidii]MCX8961097.1 isochorismatase family protein [Erwinia psidii]MCX8965473.1 isochorismatase family protein [Erwinia psidii]RQM38894.1 isochorismatase family protein [Erwinia psidii]